MRKPSRSFSCESTCGIHIGSRLDTGVPEASQDESSRKHRVSMGCFGKDNRDRQQIGGTIARSECCGCTPPARTRRFR